VIVVDASVVVEVLVGGPAGAPLRARLRHQDLAAPDIIDVEVASALRRMRLSGAVTSERLDRAVAHLARLRIDRQPSRILIRRALELRDNLTSYDGAYVALAEAYRCTLITGDRRIAAAPGIRCEVDVIH
jgi:predicted nucleic acid-binding protein